MLNAQVAHGCELADNSVVQLFFSLLVAYPLAHVYIRIPPAQKTYKHAFSVLVSSFFMYGLFRMKWGLIQLLADSVIVYGIVTSKVGVDNNGRGQGWMPWVVFWCVQG